MATLRTGVVVSWRRLSGALATLRLGPQEGGRFPPYAPGQYIALRREDCRLTKRIVDEGGRLRYVPDVDASGNPRHGPVTHAYSIASAPFETGRDGHLEFYVVLEQDGLGTPGRFTDSLFRGGGGPGEGIGYYERITGEFTLERRAAGYPNVLFVGTGTGLAPFVSMIKQLHHEASLGTPAPARYTLVHANRTRGELAYHEELSAIAASGLLDFAYVASVSRPGPGEDDGAVGTGRANNLLRHVFGMPMKEEEDGDAEALRKAVPPRLARHLTPESVRERLPRGSTVVLTCGNAEAMAEIKTVADREGMRFEKEDWKPSAPAAGS